MSRLTSHCPEPTRNPSLGVRMALLSWFNPSVPRSDRKQWQRSWQVLIAWFVLDQYQRYDQLCPVYAESLKPEWIMVFPSPGRWGNSVRVALLSGPWLGTGLAGCTFQKGWQQWVSGGVCNTGSRQGRVSQPVTAWVLQPALWWSRSSGLQHVRFWGDSWYAGKAMRGS